MLYLEKENRAETLSEDELILDSTCEPILEPELHAEPDDTAIPEISRLNNNISLSFPEGKLTFKTVYKEIEKASLMKANNATWFRIFLAQL